MDRGGRLAQSNGSQRPQADLKAAVDGALVLLRQWLSRKRESGSSPHLGRTQQPPRLISYLERRLPRRAGLFATLALLLATAGLGTVKGGHVERFTATVSDARNTLANSAGFRITMVAVQGRKQLSQDEVLAIGGVNGRSSLLFLDAASVREKLKANPWISEATVLKLYPNQLRIDIVERTPFALWQKDGRLSVISDDGVVLEGYVAQGFLSLPLVVGKGAESHARDFLALLARYPRIGSITKAAIFVGERRWNLRLNYGLDVRLPENDLGNALATLSTLDKEDHLFSRDIVAIDMRLPDRLTVQLSEEAARAREEAFKDKKPKKKVGDA